MSKKVGDILTTLRKNLELTQREVADALNVDRSTYTCYEIGKTEPNIETLMKLARIFNVSIVDLFPTEDEELAKAAEPDAVITFKTDRSKFYELSTFEKYIVMKIRIMEIEDRIKLRNFVEEDLKV